jgi:hypothetical protein
MLITGLILAALAALGVALGRPRRKETDTWDDYLGGDLELAERALGPMARRFSRSSLVQDVIEGTDEHNPIVRDLKTGGVFYRSFEIYMAVQIAAFLLGGALLAFSLLEGIEGWLRMVLIMSALIVSYWPYNHVKTKAQARSREIISHLPEFADLLLMVLPSMGVPQALAFTAERSTGPVADEMREMSRTLAARGLTDVEVFELFADRLGTPQGREFLSSLKASYLDGTTAVDTIRAQAENLRNLKYQHQRAIAKRLPVTLVVRFTIHFMPLLFILAFLPVLFSLSGVN